MQEYTVKVYLNRTEWYQQDRLHRVDGPAIEYANGTKTWYLEGKLHRVDGPAIEWTDGYKFWYLEGKELTEEEWKKRVQPDNCAGKVVEIEGKQYKLILVEK